MGEFKHISVLLNECIEGLNINPCGIYVDGTTGGGGHSLEIAKRLTTGKLICIDRDRDALRAAEEKLNTLGKNIVFVKDNYRNIKDVLKDLNIQAVDGVLLDLGVSSYQLDEADRGFSYMAEDAPLDMRMDREDYKRACDILNEYPEEELARIFWEYGEEKFSRKIARGIVLEREKNLFEKASQLNRVIEKNVKFNPKGGHPSKRVFQALRIEVNDEINGLYEFFCDLPFVLKEHGRLCIISFHSLEDRAVKNAFKYAANPCSCPREFPVCVCGKKPYGHPVNKKPVLPSDFELENNSRSKSAKLRILERIL